MKITVLGAGAWGTALARLLQQNKNDVTLWGHHAATLAEIQRAGRNERYLPGINLPRELKFEPNLERAAAGRELIVVAVPSKAFRTVTGHLGSFRGSVVSVTKGIEFDTGLTMSGILRQTMPAARIAALSGPSLALEVARGIPTAIVAASARADLAQTLQKIFHQPTFRVYSSTDLIGVEMGGALKNVIAIAAGVGDGMGFGDNSKASLVTRAIVEIRRLGVACGAHPDTFAGLSGLGDLTVTCFSKLSRNRMFGERLGRGEKIGAILFSLTAVAEGYHTACSAHQLAQKLRITTPIINEVYAMLYEGKDAGHALRDLLSRELKSED
jgi:glycerol-3-phosphate dehydrogenase (NAD(P)+)